MKKLLPLSWLLPAIIVLCSGCLKDKVTRTYQIMRPVYEDKAVVYNNIKSGPVQELSRPGKIFIRGNYLYVNEIDKGIHIFDNTDPTHPRAVSFIKIPGNLDMAVSGHYLYADMYTDLLTLDIGDPLNAKIVDSSANVFPERIFQMGWYPDGNKVIVGWIVKDTTVTDQSSNGNWWGGGCATCDFVAVPEFTSFAAKANYVPGISGSMARFVTVSNYLYAVSTSSLMVYDISNASDPQKGNHLQIGWNIETIFPFANNLFIGSRSGMFIFSISDPSNPQQLSNYQHVSSCDPVISDGDYAFVTLRSGTACEGFVNQLDVLNITDILHPQLVKTYEMHNPHGLGKDSNTLFICDGTDGVKIYNAEDVLNISLIHQIKNLNAYDVIPWEGRLVVTAEDGIHQYDYSALNNIRPLGTIHISAE